MTGRLFVTHPRIPVPRESRLDLSQLQMLVARECLDEYPAGSAAFLPVHQDGLTSDELRGVLGRFAAEGVVPLGGVDGRETDHVLGVAGAGRGRPGELPLGCVGIARAGGAGPGVLLRGAGNRGQWPLLRVPGIGVGTFLREPGVAPTGVGVVAGRRSGDGNRGRGPLPWSVTAEVAADAEHEVNVLFGLTTAWRRRTSG